MIGSNLVVEGVPGNHHHHHHHHPHHHHHHALTGAGSHPFHSFSAIHHHLNPVVSSRAHLMSSTTFAEPPFLKTSNGSGGGASLLQSSPSEFAHPLPKPAPLVARYNGVTSSSLNGAASTKPPQPPPPRLSNKYPPPESESPHGPVNLVQSKDTSSSSSSPASSVAVDVVGHPAYNLYTSSSRLYQPNPTYPPHFAPPPPPPPPSSSLQPGPYGPLYSNPFTSMLHSRSAENHRTTHLLSLQQYSDSNTPPHLKSPPTSTGLNGVVKTIYEPPIVPIVTSETTSSGCGGGSRGEKRPFKVPSGKEGSMKHRILTSREAPRGAHKKTSVARSGSNNTMNTLLPPPSTSSVSSMASSAASHIEKNGPTASSSPTDSAATAILNNANNISSSGGSGSYNCSNVCNSSSSSGSDDRVHNPVLPKFIKGSLIKLANGSLKKVEDMQTEDFISCVENSTTVRIDPSTVVRIQENAHKKGMTTVTLSYGEQRNQVDVETSVEHPYFVVKRGWSSYSPNKTLQVYRLSCHQLQVGDVCLTLSPKTTSDATRKSDVNSGLGGGGGGSSNSGGSSSSSSSSSSSQRRPNGHTGVVATVTSNIVESSKMPSSSAAVAKKNDLKINSSDSKDNDEIHASNNCNSSCSNNNNNSSGISISSSINNNNNNKNNDHRYNHNHNNDNRRHHQHHHHPHKNATHHLVDSQDISIKNDNGGNFSRMSMTNGHEESKKFDIKVENDNNNNSNSTSDKYDSLPSAKKKRRWSAPDQITDEYQPSSSPLASPPVSTTVTSSAGSGGGGAGGVAAVGLSSKNNV